MLTLREHAVGQNFSPKVANKPSEKKKFKYFGTTPTKQNYVHEKKNYSRCNPGNACYLLAQKIWSTSLIPKNTHILRSEVCIFTNKIPKRDLTILQWHLLQPQTCTWGGKKSISRDVHTRVP